MQHDEHPTVQTNSTGTGSASESERASTRPVSFSLPTQSLDPVEPAPGTSQQTMVLNQPAPAFAWLAMVSGARAGRLFPLHPQGTTLGRDAQNDIVLDDTAVSRLHAKLRKEPGARKSVEQFYIQDMGSANGTFVNDQKIVRKPLSDGDRIRVGETILVFKTIEQVAPSKPKAKKSIKRTAKTKRTKASAE